MKPELWENAELMVGLIGGRRVPRTSDRVKIVRELCFEAARYAEERMRLRCIAACNADAVIPDCLVGGEHEQRFMDYKKGLTFCRDRISALGGEYGE